MPNLSVVTANVQTVNDDWLDTLLKTIEPEPITFKDDPVAMAFSSYRAWKENHTSRWVDLGAVPVNEQDRTNAELLRSYYRRVMTWQALKNGTGNASTFRRKLAAIASNTHTYTKEDIGLLHRLPYFYYEDLALDRVFAATKDPVQDIGRAERIETTLTPVERILRSRRAGDYIHFYWKDQNSVPNLLVVKSDNTLISIVEALFKQPTIKLQAVAFPKHPRGYHQSRTVYQLANVEVL